MVNSSLVSLSLLDHGDGDVHGENAYIHYMGQA